MENQNKKYRVTKIKTLKTGQYEGSAVVILEPDDDAVGRVTMMTECLERTGFRLGRVYAFQEVQP